MNLGRILFVLVALMLALGFGIAACTDTSHDTATLTLNVTLN